MPNTGQGLASYWDAPFLNDIYDPLDGDFPIVERMFRNYLIPDEMVFWIFNDAGGVHNNSNGDPVQMEFQTTAYAFKQAELDYTTFYDIKTINWAIEDIRNTHFGLWLNVGGDDINQDSSVAL